MDPQSSDPTIRQELHSFLTSALAMFRHNHQTPRYILLGRIEMIVLSKIAAVEGGVQDGRFYDGESSVRVLPVALDSFREVI